VEKIKIMKAIYWSPCRTKMGDAITWSDIDLAKYNEGAKLCVTKWETSIWRKTQIHTYVPLVQCVYTISKFAETCSQPLPWWILGYVSDWSLVGVICTYRDEKVVKSFSYL